MKYYVQIQLVFLLMIGCFQGLAMVKPSKSLQPNLNAIHQPTNDSIKQLITNYHQGFINKNFDLVRNSIGQQLIMINGNFSNDPMNWQAHQFLNTVQIDDWINRVLNNAGPFNNEIEIKKIHINANSAIIIANEHGNNKFRNWENEQVVYMLGKINLEWKIIGFYIKDIKNPD